MDLQAKSGLPAWTSRLLTSAILLAKTLAGLSDVTSDIRALDGFASTLAYGRPLTYTMLLVEVLRRREIPSAAAAPFGTRKNSLACLGRLADS